MSHKLGFWLIRCKSRLYTKGVPILGARLNMYPYRDLFIFARSHKELLCCCQLLPLQQTEACSDLLGEKVPNQSHTKNTNRDCLQSQNIQAGKYCKSRSNVLKKLLSTRLRKLVTPTPALKKKKTIYTTPYRHKGKNECAKPKEQQIARLASALEDDSRNFQSMATVYLLALTTNLRTLITIYYIRPLILNK